MTDDQVFAALDTLDTAFAAWRIAPPDMPTLRAIALALAAYPPDTQRRIGRAIGQAVSLAVEALRAEGILIDDDHPAPPSAPVH